MSKFWKTLAQQWPDGVNFVLGIWLIASPWVLQYATQTTPAWNAYVVGVIIAVAALSALLAFHQWEEWVNVVLGAWLIVSPWLLGFSALTNVVWNQVVTGLVAGALALWAAYKAREHGQFAT
jgi:hypothetical protein